MMSTDESTSSAWAKEVVELMAKYPLTMKSGEVAEIFRVDPKTVTRWAKADRLKHWKTPGGHTRFDRDEVLKTLLDGEVVEQIAETSNVSK